MLARPPLPAWDKCPRAYVGPFDRICHGLGGGLTSLRNYRPERSSGTV